MSEDMSRHSDIIQIKEEKYEVLHRQQSSPSFSKENLSCLAVNAERRPQDIKGTEISLSKWM